MSVNRPWGREAQPSGDAGHISGPGATKERPGAVRAERASVRPWGREAQPSGGGVAILPGTFNPPTVAHLEMARAARRQAGLDRIDLVLSRVSLGKEQLARPTVDERADVLRAVAASNPWLSVHISDAQLVSDLAAGYDVLVVGADKWHQLLDPSYYESSEAHRAALARLPPRVLVAPRDGDAPEDVELLEIDEEFTVVSSSLARAGHRHLMLPEAIDSGFWPPPPPLASGSRPEGLPPPPLASGSRPEGL